ncbi:MAG: hypothetical protein NTV03_00950 [Candidatus Nomurabacteria bacterium]|nr:hypothetical protein [Candidatus Nomurabacteria bacterium]
MFSFIIFLSFAPKVFASTIVIADITTDTTWDLAGSPYIIQNDKHVASGVTLTIDPGVVVKLSQGNLLWIDGKLLAEGNADNKIVFTSIDDDSYGGDTGDGDSSTAIRGWYGVIFTQTATPSILKYIVEIYTPQS